MKLDWWHKTDDAALLSDYLQGELSEQARQVSERLAREPQLAQQYRQLQFIRSTLRSLPEQPLPRNFTLTAAQAQKRSPNPAAAPTDWLPQLRLVAMLASVVFVVSVAGGWWHNLNQYQAITSYAVPAAPVVVTEPLPSSIAEISTKQQATEAPIAATAALQQDLSGYDNVNSGDSIEANSSTAAGAAAVSGATEQNLPLATATLSLVSDEASVASATEAVSPMAADPPSTSTEEVAIAAEARMGEPAQPSAPITPSPLNYWQWLQIISGATAFSLFILWLVMRRLRH